MRKILTVIALLAVLAIWATPASAQCVTFVPGHSVSNQFFYGGYDLALQLALEREAIRRAALGDLALRDLARRQGVAFVPVRRAFVSDFDRNFQFGLINVSGRRGFSRNAQFGLINVR